jgi:pyruvate/2-oxoglutarate dehydrogenase complex dihydrolipoamide dehydrogenase (E3) component
MLDCKYLIIGSGESGLMLAKNLAKLGKILLVEESEIGGSYINSLECPKHLLSIKSENFISSLKLFKNYPETFSILTKYRQKLNTEITDKIKEKRQEMINDLQKNSNIKIIKGRAEFVSKTLVEINSQEERHLASFEQVLLAVGKNVMQKPNIEGAENIEFLFRHNAFLVEKIPSKIALIGCTKETLEVASIFSGIGVKVEIFEKKPVKKVLPKLDKSLFNYLIKSLSPRNVSFLFETEIIKLEKNKKLIILTDHTQKIHTVSDIYFEIKESFGSDLLGLNKIDLKWVKEGIVCNQWGKTIHNHIWAFGECSSSCKDNNKYFAIQNFIQKQFLESQNKKSLPINFLNSYFNENEISPINFGIIKINSFRLVINIGLSEQSSQAVYGNQINSEIITNPILEGFLKIIYRENGGQVLGFVLAGDFCNLLENYAILSLKKNANYKQVKFFLESYNGW